MQFATSPALFSLSAVGRRAVLLAMITIGIAIQLSVPDGTTVTGIDVHGHTETGQTISVPQAVTVTGTTVPQSVTTATAPRSATSVTAPRSATATTPPRSQTSSL